MATASTNAGLLVVDVQNDFCPGGALPAPDGGRILSALNRHLAAARALGIPVYASRDWHPPITGHFKAYGGEWPPHCVQGTTGAQFHPGLMLPVDVVVISKGDNPDRPGYSAFEGRTPQGNTLLGDLQDHQIDSLYVAGIATEYCVKATVMDALAAGLRVTVLPDAVAAIDTHPGDADRALEEMSKAGAVIAHDIVA